MSDLDKISSVFNAKIDSVKTKDDLQNIKTEFFGKNGQITLQFKSLGSLDPETRKEFASLIFKILLTFISSRVFRALLIQKIEYLMLWRSHPLFIPI